MYHFKTRVFDSLQTMCYDSSSDEYTNSESEDDLQILLLDAILPSRKALGPRLNLQDVSETDCEKWFRYWFVKSLRHFGFEIKLVRIGI